MDSEIITAFAIFGGALALFVFASWKAMKPHNSVQPRMIPWRPLIFVFGLGVVFAAYYLAAKLGFTGPPSAGMAP